MTLFGKTRLGLLASLHSLADKVIDLNSIQAVRQLIRDLEQGQEQVENALAEATANKVGTQREVDRLQGEMKRLDGQIDALLAQNPNNPGIARPLQAKFSGDKTLFATQQGILQDAITALAALQQAKSVIDTKHTTMMQQLSRLEVMHQSTVGKEAAATAVKQAASFAGSGTGVSVDDLVTREQHRADVADAKLQSAMGSFDRVADHDEQLASVDADLAARMEKLKSNAVPVGA